MVRHDGSIEVVEVKSSNTKSSRKVRQKQAMKEVVTLLGTGAGQNVAERLLFGAAEEMCGGDHPAGCLLVQGALAAGSEATSVRRELASRRDQARALLHQRLRRAKKEGDLPPDADPAALARYLMTVLNGMAVQGAGGATRNDLRRVAEIALKSWPKSS